MSKHVPRLLSRLCLGYAAFMTVWWVLRLIFFDTVWWMALLNTVALFLFLPLPVLLLIALARRRWRALCALVLPVAIFSALFGAVLVPPWPAVTSPARTSVSVMTFNLLYSNRDFGAMGAAIRASHPDILGIQEVERSQMMALQELLRDDYPYAQFHKPEHEAGVGLFSRFPITAADSFPLPPRQLALRATVMVPNASIDVMVVHLSPNRALQLPLAEMPTKVAAHYATQTSEIAFIKRALASTNRPILLLCDCNMTDTSQAYATLAAQLRDSFREAGWGFGHTYPAGPLPLQRYDYIWHSAEFIAERAEVGLTGGSDHFPVVARLALVATGGLPRFEPSAER